MREETRPIVGPLLGIVGGALPAYWAAVEVWVLWRTTPKSKLVHLLVGSQTKVTGALISELRTWFAAVMVVEALVALSAFLLLLYPRRHFLLGVGLLSLSALGLALMGYFPLGLGRTELVAGMVLCPILGLVAGISALLFRSDLEFARAYGFD